MLLLFGPQFDRHQGRRLRAVLLPEKGLSPHADDVGLGHVAGQGQVVQLLPVCICARPADLHPLLIDIAPHYGIDEPMWFLKCCFPVLTLYQVFDTVLRRENLHTSCAASRPDTGAPRSRRWSAKR